MRVRTLLAMVAMLLVAMTGVASAQEPTGFLIFEHDIEGAPAVEVVVIPFVEDEEDDEVSLGTAEFEDVIEAELPEGTHEIEIRVGGTTIASGEFEIVADEDTLVLASELVAAPSPSPSPTATATATATASPSPTAIRTPGRVETGAGGAAGDDDDGLLAGLAVIATLSAAGAVALATRRHAS